MTTQDFTPKESFELISKVINEAKTKFEENGAMYIMWGILVAVASFSQFILLKNEYYNINYYPYFLLPPGIIVTWVYYYQKEKAKSNQVSTMVGYAWGATGLNIMILGFLFFDYLQASLVPVILILLGIAYVYTGSAIKNKLVLFSGILINISGFVCFNLDLIYHSLLMSIVSVLFVLIPGIILKKKYNKRNLH